MVHRQLAVVVIAAIIGLCDSAASDYYQICHRFDANLPECIKNSILNASMHFRKGITELGIPSLEPLSFDRLPFRADSDEGGMVNNLTDFKVWGIPDTDITNVTARMTKRYFHLWYKMRIPILRIEGIYDVNTKILFLQLKGHGFLQINSTNVQCDVTLRGLRIDRNGEEYLQFEKMTGTMDLKNPRVRVDGLFQDPTLNAAMNDIINENFGLIFEDVKPTVLDVLFTTFTEYANKVATKFTLNELLPK